ncbi:MAG: hypothetical protein JW801_03770 [Bacteroidales bacterium]|nr:hypothetical protein [Bacteroidales bacterium]
MYRLAKVSGIFYVILLLSLLSSCLPGRLQPFSPHITGFEKKELNKAVIYYREGDSISEFTDIDSLICQVEESHHLQFQRKVAFFVMNSEKKYRHYTGTRARFVAQPLYGRIYISPRAKEEYRADLIRFDTYIKHELSHSLFFQNVPFIRLLNYPGWFLEGLAVYTAAQAGTDGYYSYESVEDTIRAGYFAEPRDWGTITRREGETVRQCPLKGKYHFIYSEYAWIIHGLVLDFGEDKFVRFLHDSLKTKDFYALFRSTYGIDFDEYISQQMP